jgi:hypothetical protein
MVIVTDNSFLLFVYPFLFDTAEFDVRVEAADAATVQTGRHHPNVWQLVRFPGAEMLAYVADYLNPKENKAATARLWKLNPGLRKVFGLEECADWRLSVKNDSTPFYFGDKELKHADFAVQLALFRFGIGFLTFRVRPKSDRLDDWLDFAHYFRFVARPKDVRIQAIVSQGDAIPADSKGQPFFPEPAGGLSDHPEGKGVLNNLIEGLLKTLHVSGACWWREVFVPEQVIPFAGIFVNGISPGEDLHLAYRLRNFFHKDQGMHPSAEDLDPLHPGLLAYAQRQWFIFSLDGGSFLGCDVPNTSFFREILPQHVRDQYFLLFLITLQQRFLLMSLSQQVSESWLKSKENEKANAFAEIRNTLLQFTARGMFTQVMQREHHHRCYRKWQEIFQIQELYQEVRDEVREMHDYLQMKRTEANLQLAQETQGRAQRLSQTLSWFGVFIGVPALIIGFLGINLVGITSRDDGLRIWTALAVTLTGVTLAGIILLIIRSRSSKSNRSEADSDGKRK